jgi:hypothetical protein
MPLINPASPYIIIALIVSHLAIGGAGYHYGGKHTRNEITAETLKTENEELLELQQQLEEQVALSNDISKKFEVANRARQAAQTKVREYETKLIGCGTVPNDFIRLHDYAAKGYISKTPDTREFTCSPSTIGIDRVGGVISRNYEKCNKYIDQLNSLIDILEKK